MVNDSQEKQHLPTAKRMADLRKKGHVMRSREFSGALVFIVPLILLLFIAARIKEQLEHNIISSFTLIKNVSRNDDMLFMHLKEIAYANFSLLLPIFVVVMIGAFMTPFLFGGWNFTLDSISFKWDKLNPVTNLKNLFSYKRASIEILKSLLKAVCVLSILGIFIYQRFSEISAMSALHPTVGMESAYDLGEEFLIMLTLVLGALILIDVLQSYFKYQQQAKMSDQELKDEYKEMEGNVEVKRKIRSAQFTLLKQSLVKSIPKAHVIITNPTHYAVALRYDNNKDRAPRVLAKGKGLVAQEIRRLASPHAIPIYEAPPLARAIYFTSNVGGEIHPSLYMAVAIVLSYIHQLKNYQLGLCELPKLPADLNLPKELSAYE